MSDQLHGAAAFQQRFRQRLSLFGQSSTITFGDNDGQQEHQQLWLDDPVIGGVKRHFVISSRIGFEPVSQKFARIAFFVKRRKVLMVTGVNDVFGQGQVGQENSENCLQLNVTKKVNDVNQCSFEIPPSKVSQVLQSLFRHIRKWRTIYFGHRIGPNGEGMCHCSATSDVSILGRLVDAILAESPETIDVRQFFNNCQVHSADQHRMAEFVRRCAPNLRSLWLPLRRAGNDQQTPPMPLLAELVQAIYTCRQLRELYICFAAPQQLPPDFLATILALPHMADVQLGDYGYVCIVDIVDGSRRLFVRRFFPNIHRLSVDNDWLQFIGRLPDATLLKNVQHLRAMHHSDQLAIPAPIDVLWAIAAQMRSPVYVDVDGFDSNITWQTIWNDYLPMVYRTGANFERNVIHGLPIITTEEFDAGLATLAPIIQIALTVPNLATAPIRNNRYEKLEFSFASGAKLTVKTFRV